MISRNHVITLLTQPKFAHINCRHILSAKKEVVWPFLDLLDEDVLGEIEDERILLNLQSSLKTFHNNYPDSSRLQNLCQKRLEDLAGRDLKWLKRGHIIAKVFQIGSWLALCAIVLLTWFQVGLQGLDWLLHPGLLLPTVSCVTLILFYLFHIFAKLSSRIHSSQLPFYFKEKVVKETLIGGFLLLISFILGLVAFMQVTFFIPLVILVLILAIKIAINLGRHGSNFTQNDQTWFWFSTICLLTLFSTLALISLWLRNIADIRIPLAVVSAVNSLSIYQLLKLGYLNKKSSQFIFSTWLTGHVLAWFLNLFLLAAFFMSGQWLIIAYFNPSYLTYNLGFYLGVLGLLLLREFLLNFLSHQDERQLKKKIKEKTFTNFIEGHNLLTHLVRYTKRDLPEKVKDFKLLNSLAGGLLGYGLIKVLAQKELMRDFDRLEELLASFDFTYILADLAWIKSVYSGDWEGVRQSQDDKVYRAHGQALARIKNAPETSLTYFQIQARWLEMQTMFIWKLYHFYMEHKEEFADLLED